MIRNILRRLMLGRYGMDTLSKFLSSSGIIAVMLASFFQRRKIGVLFYFVGWGLLIYCVVRIFSRNLKKRAAENQKFLERIAKIKAGSTRRKIYHIYKCPKCGQKIRIPKGKGRVEISCPKCGEKFIRRS